MNWFSAKLIFVTEMRNAEDDDPLREESIRVFRAVDEQGAIDRAASVGKSAEHEYLNEQGETVRWTFLRVDEVQDLCEETLEDGMEVFSRITHAVSDSLA